MEMNDNQKAASILRQYAGEIYQGHTIGGQWPEESAHIEREHDELIALADRLASQPQERGEAVAWVSPAGLQCLREGIGGASAVDGVGFAEVYSKQDYECDGTIPLYLHPTPDAGRVAELEAELAESAKCAFEYAAKVGELEQQLAESREREGRMREALDGNKLYWLDGNPEEGGEWGDTIDRLNCNMDEPFKIGDKIKVQRALVLPDAHIVVTAVDEDGQIIECEDAALTADKEGE